MLQTLGVGPVRVALRCAEGHENSEGTTTCVMGGVPLLEVEPGVSDDLMPRDPSVLDCAAETAASLCVTGLGVSPHTCATIEVTTV